jgi:hypothetical protein
MLIHLYRRSSFYVLPVLSGISLPGHTLALFIVYRQRTLKPYASIAALWATAIVAALFLGMFIFLTILAVAGGYDYDDYDDYTSEWRVLITLAVLVGIYCGILWALFARGVIARGERIGLVGEKLPVSVPGSVVYERHMRVLRILGGVSVVLSILLFALSMLDLG